MQRLCLRALRVLALGAVALGAVAVWLLPAPVFAALPQGYFVWSHGAVEDAASRKIYRMTLPDRSDVRALTAGEDIEPQVSPDGKWVAYAKAKFPGGSDYHDFKLWKIYIVSIHGAADRRREIKIDDDGAWPSWSKSGALYYNQADGTHSRIVRVTIDERGLVTSRKVVLATAAAFGGFVEVNEAAVAPDESWFAARTRGNPTQNGVGAFTFNPPAALPLARAGDIGCMPRMAPSGTFAIIAGATEGIRWGHGPGVPGRKEDQLLIPAAAGHLAYHPDLSSDERWVLAADGTDPNHNSGRYEVSIYPFDATTMSVGPGEPLTVAGFNGWPHLWVGPPSTPPAPRAEIAAFSASRYTVAPGETVAFAWTTFGADDVLLDGEAVAPEGTKELVAAASGPHTLAVRTAGAVAEMRTLELTVNASPQPVAIAEFVATAARIEKGRSTTLRWRAQNAVTLDLDGQPVTPAEAREVTPLETTTYTLTAQGAAGPVRAQVTVVVEEQASGLLPDRGGFQCAATPLGRGGAAAFSVAFALAAWIAKRRTTKARRRAEAAP